MDKIKDLMREINTKLLHYMMAQINQNKIIIKPHHYMIIKITNNKIKEWLNNNIKKSNLNNKISNSHYIILASFNNKAKNNGSYKELFLYSVLHHLSGLLCKLYFMKQDYV